MDTITQKKCEKYWPQTSNINKVYIPCLNSMFTVKMDSEHPNAEFVIRKLTLSKVNLLYWELIHLVL